MSDDFDNFFDDQRPSEQPETPIYHTPEPKRKTPNVAVIVSVVLSVVMCLVVIVNVLVLATLKQSIANQYAESLEQSMKEQYAAAINEALENSDIVDDVVEQATANSLYALETSIGNVADEKVAPSVARLYMYTETDADISYDSYSGLASGFLITDTNEAGTLERYLVTNAHAVRYEKVTYTRLDFWRTQQTYTWESYGTIVCVFEGDSNVYRLEIVAYGAYSEDNLTPENDQADLAILRIVGKQSRKTVTSGVQPSNTAHPSLKLAYNDSVISRGMDVALVGNPQGMGDGNSIAVGVVSQTGITISSWGSGTFIMTDAAINGGNSGGPMVNSLGYVIGVVESKIVATNIDNMGFALSIDTLHSFLTWASQAAHNELGENLTLALK